MLKKNFFPSKLINLQEMWCSFAKCLNEIKISPNKILSLENHQLNKINIEVFVFSVRNIKNAKIP